MNRHAFVTGLGAVLAGALAGEAQQPKMSTIGVLVVGAPGSENFWRLFQQAMRELGYIDGRTVRFEFRSDLGQVNRLPSLADDLVRLKVDLIVAWFTPAALAAKQATREIPIVKPRAARRKHNRDVRRGRRAGREVRRESARTAPIGPSGGGSGQCARPVLETVSGKDSARRQSHGHDDRPDNHDPRPRGT